MKPGMEKVSTSMYSSSLTIFREPQWVDDELLKVRLAVWAMPCLIRDDDCVGRTQIHHVKSRGAGGKDPENIVPLCAYHHRVGHQNGWKTFAKRYDIDLTSEAARVWKAIT